MVRLKTLNGTNMRQINVKTPEITRRSVNINRYFDDVNQYPTLTALEEQDLITNDPDWRAKLVLHNLKFVISVGNKYYAKTDDDFQDILQAGNEGLIIASEHFDPSKGFRFISFAVWWIRQRIQQFLGENDAVTLPLNKINLLNVISSLRFQDRDFDTYSNAVILEKVVELTNSEKYTERHIDEMRNYNRLAKSLNVCYGDNDSMEAIEFIVSDSDTEYDNSSEVLQQVIKNIFGAKPKLDKYYYVVVHYYGLFGNKEKCLEELAGDLNLTRERCRQILKYSIRLLRKHPNLKELLCKDYIL